MFFIPIGTDAPLYHWPYATVGVIVATVLAFFVQVNVLVDEARPLISMEAFEETLEDGGAEEPAEDLGWRSLQGWMLATGDGIHPVQWLSHIFLHEDPIHLVGNMMFLWCFGLIVEGKVGPWAFLGLYLGTGVVGGALVQSALQWADPGYALGASGAVFGLLAISLIWAPMNEFNVFYFFMFGFRIFTGMKEIAVVWFALLYFALNVFGFVISLLMNDGMLTLSSELGHLTGGLLGLAAGTALFKARLVDCEGWDVFAIWKKGAEKKAAIWRGGEPPKRKRRREAPAEKKRARGAKDEGLSDGQRVEDAQRRIRAMLDQGMPVAALAVYRKSAENLEGWRLEEGDYLRLIKELHAEKAWADSLPVIRDFVRAYPEKGTKPRLRMAQVLIRELERPAAGLKVLSELQGEALPPDLEKVRRQLLVQAAHMQEEGVLELEEEV